MFSLLDHFSITFDAARHLYTRNGERLDNVTSCLPYLEGNDFLDKNPGVMERAGERGHRVARYIEECEAMTADPTTLGQTGLAGVVGLYSVDVFTHTEAYQRFKKDTGFTALKFPHGGQIASELFVYHPTLGYAGCLDLVGVCAHQSNDVILIDVKASANIPKTVGWQTAAYLEAYNKNASLYGLPKAKKRACLHLNPKLYKCGYRLEPLTDPNDFSSFACLLGAHRLARRLDLQLEFKPIARNSTSNEGESHAPLSPEGVFA